ncbi:hypothetical protein MTR_8g028540 [Medicago truncatula]|uniref:Uncharacterized protein n=1 Tax=Medicago truncatula TaxID=3880 RepID=A0A072TPM8_MEDTR|nr:hypothetical protein MTR_8g028540 [Medicago truncatula]
MFVQTGFCLKNCEKVPKTCLEHVFIMVGNCHIESQNQKHFTIERLSLGEGIQLVLFLFVMLFPSLTSLVKCLTELLHQNSYDQNQL